MPRACRSDYPGAWSHVMNRGSARRTIFETRADVRHFLALLAHAARRGGIDIHAYCLMATHYHLLVRSKTARLAAGCRAPALARQDRGLPQLADDRFGRVLLPARLLTLRVEDSHSIGIRFRGSCQRRGPRATDPLARLPRSCRSFDPARRTSAWRPVRSSRAASTQACAVRVR
jgi:hypothetical protein